jgi:hypothetical protein
VPHSPSSPPSPPRTLAFPALDGLLGGGAAEFLVECWEQRPLLVAARDDRDRAFLRAQDGGWRDLVRAATASQRAAVQTIAGAKPHAVAEGEIDTEFAEGASVRVLRVQEGWPPLQALCEALAWEFGFRVSANLYVTPQHRQGLDTHTDSHDVFVVQMSGTKEWTVFGRNGPLPLEYRTPLSFERDASLDEASCKSRGWGYGGSARVTEGLGAPLVQCVLNPGDLLYIPRGFPHVAHSRADTSAHLTIGVHATTWADLLTIALGQRALGDGRLKESIPAGANRLALSAAWIEKELRERSAGLLEGGHGNAVLTELALRFRQALPGKSDNARGAGSPGRFRLTRSAFLSFDGDIIWVRSLDSPASAHAFPASLRPAFERLLRGDGVEAASLPPLTLKSAETLLKFLEREGVVHQAAP